MVGKAHTVQLVRFQRYLTKHYPVTSAMSYEIGKYVLENIIEKQELSIASGIRKAPTRDGTGSHTSIG